MQWTTTLFTTLGFILKCSPPFHILAIKLKMKMSAKLLQVYWGGAPSLPTPYIGMVAMVEPSGREPRTMKVDMRDFSFSFLFYVIFMTILVTRVSLNKL